MMSNLQVLFTILIFITLTTPQVSSILPKVHPIVWGASSDTLKSGNSRAILKIKFETPCVKFYTAKIVPDTLPHFTEWCDNEALESVIRPLEEMCRPSFAGGPSPVPGRRKKRGILAGIVTALPTVVSAVSTIVGLFSKPKPPQNDAAINEIISKINEISKNIAHLEGRIAAGEKRQAELEAVVKELAAFLEKLDARMRVVEIGLEEINSWRTELTASLGSTITLTSKLGAYFTQAKSDLSEVARDWREGHLNLKLFDVFMMGTNFSLIDIYKGSKPEKCHLNILDGVATFSFHKNNTDFGVQVLQAYPFSMYEMVPGTDLGWQLEYVGPRRAAFDKIADCIVPFSGGQVDVLRFPGEQDCLPMNDMSVYKYWQKSCRLMYYLDETVIQVKAVEQLYYIYCYGFEVRIYKSKYKCPNYVFSINSNEKIEILNGASVAKTLTPGNFEAAQDLHSTKAVYHLIPKIMALDFDTFPASNECPKSMQSNKEPRTGEILGKIEDENKVDVATNQSLLLGGFAIIGVVLVLMGIGGMFYIRHKTRQSKQQQEQHHPRHYGEQGMALMIQN
ncbi:hypothetical protein Fcan01_11092 [Folsomia candida]|uniref:Uncharacterized protein n=1 Tax=Folsomia candida TaxID=158441 RepID=A0A226EBQ3_FOLCA|nr:hypothetical protein Fcan01_11092 [Folsomia candida]